MPGPFQRGGFTFQLDPAFARRRLHAQLIFQSLQVSWIIIE
jgi:hypothetical protein